LSGAAITSVGAGRTVQKRIGDYSERKHGQLPAARPTSGCAIGALLGGCHLFMIELLSAF